MDAKYIQTVQKLFGTKKIKTLPNLWMSKWLKWIIIDRIKKIRPLYNIDYKKDEVRAFLTNEFGWKYYGGHHMENRTSYFTNNYWLPKKFGYDLRYSELSALVRDGQLSREKALVMIKEPKIFDAGILQEIYKRLSLTPTEFEQYFNAPNKTYRDYKTYKETFEKMKPLFYLLYKANLVPLSFYLKYTRKYKD
jgi:hypothetical protein